MVRMHVSHPQSYLVLGSSRGYEPPSILITPDFPEVLSTWTAGTRCSPIWRTHAPGAAPAPRFDFPGEHLFVLLGPVQLASLCSDLEQLNDPSLFSIWVTAGILNVALLADIDDRSRSALAAITEWCLKKKSALEWWEIKKGKVTNGGTLPSPSSTASIPKKLVDLGNIPGPSILKGALQEYCALMSSALCRSKDLVPYIHEDLLQINEVIVEEVELFKSDEIRYIDIYLRLLNVNAALSRFSSQAFSGTPPVLQTECHYWIHSLLGTGSANIAISKLSAHIRRTLGDARIPERLSAMKDKRDKVPTLDQLSSDPDFLDSDHLVSHELEGDTKPTIPLITYFSGRDGFSSHIYTLSAPLTTIAECNSLRSSLLTITHELSHIQIRGVLSVVYPDIDNEEHIKLAVRMLTPNYRATDWLDAAKQLLLEALVSMEQEWRGVDQFSGNELQDPSTVKRILRSWRREAQEILVHTFDFLYFYASKPDVYISSIWHSWCAIPGIADRVPEYVIRTLSATGSSHLKLENNRRLDATKDHALTQFRLLKNTDGILSNYVELAIEHIENHWQSSNGVRGVRDKLRAALLLTRFTKLFLYSETFSAQIFSDTYISSSSTKESGYAQKKNEFSLTPIGNPLRFLSENIKDTPTETESLWVLQNLAYNSSDGNT